MSEEPSAVKAALGPWGAKMASAGKVIRPGPWFFLLPGCLFIQERLYWLSSAGIFLLIEQRKES